jgi:hypothetical protein
MNAKGKELNAKRIAAAIKHTLKVLQKDMNQHEMERRSK